MAGIAHLQPGVQVAGGGLRRNHDGARVGGAVGGPGLRHKMFALPGALGLRKGRGVAGFIRPFEAHEVARPAVNNLNLHGCNVESSGHGSYYKARIFKEHGPRG
jgi:hypothetical protein